MASTENKRKPTFEHYIVVRKSLPADTDVVQIAKITGKHCRWIVGTLIEFWAWADSAVPDGFAPGVSRDWIDEYFRCRKFAEALESVGWLVLSDAGATLPDFDRFMGNSAKKRIANAKRQADCRANVTPDARQERDESVTRV